MGQETATSPHKAPDGSVRQLSPCLLHMSHKPNTFVCYFFCVLQCLAIDTRGSSIAAGDVSGRILLWHGLRTALAELQAGREARPMGCSTMHWHSYPVACLNFTLDSAYLLSGGQEAVLVGVGIVHLLCLLADHDGAVSTLLTERHSCRLLGSLVLVIESSCHVFLAIWLGLLWTRATQDVC